MWRVSAPGRGDWTCTGQQLHETTHWRGRCCKNEWGSGPGSAGPRYDVGDTCAQQCTQAMHGQHLHAQPKRLVGVR